MNGDFTGFSFNNIHSSRLGIVRVSNGDRYSEELLPEVSDRTNEIVGNDGENYFGSEFRTKTFNINLAYDSMTETQFRKLRRLFGTKEVCKLIFDERPYKVYSVKVAQPPELEYVCFDEQKKHLGETIQEGGIRYIEKNGERVREDITPWVYEFDNNGQPITERIYKGEGEIELVAYYPYARQQFKTLDLYTSGGNAATTYENIEEWAESSGILTAAQFNDYNIDKTLVITEANNYNLKIPVYNPGDLDTGFYLYIPFTDGKIEPDSGNYIYINGDTNTLLLRPIYQKSSQETGVIINTVNHLIEGVQYDPVSEHNDYSTRTWLISHNIYNEYIEAGSFPKIIRSDFHFDDDQFKQAIYLNCKIGEEGEENQIKIDYDYLYF